MSTKLINKHCKLIKLSIVCKQVADECVNKLSVSLKRKQNLLVSSSFNLESLELDGLSRLKQLFAN